MQSEQSWKTEYSVPAEADGEASRLIHCALTPDIMLLLCDIHSTRIPNFRLTEAFGPEPDLVVVNYCFRGRCEVGLKTGECDYLSNGEIAVDAGFARMAVEHFFFPAADYCGIALIVRAGAAPKREYILEGKPVIVPDDLRDKVRGLGKPCLSQTGAETRACFETIRSDILNDRPRELMMLDVLRTLFHISERFPGTEPRRTYYSKSQVQIAKAVRELLTSDLGKRYSASELAARFCISETSLKNYFRGVYGCGYGEFQSELRMRRAAELLSGARQKISDVGEMVGFSNQSAFARAFREYYGVTPVEYRRQQRLMQREGHGL